jgi:hypothetical protein
MARYAYDVNTTQRYIDVHKQFQGGLKTVDTDDSLGAVFLRQAENVSLSEFGFVEKRYGTYENFKKQISGNLQGYWEFENSIVYAVDGNLYIDDNKITNYYISGLNRYPDFDSIFTQGNFLLESGLVKITDGAAFQQTRDMNAVFINDILYMFTGTYPIYLVKEGNLLKFYLQPVQVPTYDEIVVVGHNLLEDDYETLYSEKNLNFTGGSSYNPGVTSVIVEDSNYLPKFPFVYDTETEEKGSLTFDFKTKFPVNNDFVPWGTGSNQPYIQIVLDSAQYKISGPGSSTLDFIPLDKSEIDFDVIDNYSGQESSFEVFSDNILDRAYFESGETNFKQTRPFNGANQYNRGTYSFTKRIAVSKEIMQNSITFGFTLFKKLENSFETFNLSQYQHTFQDSTIGSEFLEAKIIAIDAEGNEKETVYFPTLIHVSGNYTFSRPSINFFNTSGFIVEISHRVNEAILPVTDALEGPTDFEDTSKYAVSFVSVFNLNVGTKKLTSATIPGLGLTLKNLLVGTFDFEFSFKINAYYYNTLTKQLKLGFSDSFFTQVNNITITAEKLQDYPGAENVPVKLKPIWSCNKVIEHFGKLMVWGSTQMSSSVFYSFPDRPTYFPSKFYLDFKNDDNDPVEAVTPYMNILVVQTEETTWGVRGNSGLIDSPSPYISFSINPTVGTIAYKSVRPVRNHLFFLSKQGVIALKSLYAADEQYNIEFVDRNIRNIVPQDTQAVGIQYDNQYWLNFPQERITLRWYIDKKAWVQDKYQSWNQFNGVLKYQIKDGKLEFITKPSRFLSTENLGFYKIGVDDALPTDLGRPILAKFETSFLNQNYPFHPKNYKEAKLDFTLQNEYNLGREAVYEMETDEDISGNIHTIPNTLLKNHRYRLEYDFIATPQIIIDGGTYTNVVFEDALDGGNNYESATEFLDLFYYTAVASVSLNGILPQLFNIDFETLEFLLPNNIESATEIVVVGDFSGYTGGAYLRDVTYDDSLNFNTWVLSEEQTLNIDNYEGYAPSLQNVNLDLTLKDRFGDWVFGQSDFGNKVTAIKTIKLSGRGYNSKIYLEDLSKSKWTMESLGITYKMKRARSR